MYINTNHLAGKNLCLTKYGFYNNTFNKIYIRFTIGII